MEKQENPDKKLNKDPLLKVQYLCNYNCLVVGKKNMRVDFLDCNFTRAQKSGTFVRHMHMHYELLYIQKGPYRANVNGESLELDAGDILIVQSGQYHEDIFSKGCELFGFHFNMEPGLSLFQPGIPIHRQVLHLQEDKATVNLLQSVLGLLQEQEFVSERNFAVCNYLFMAVFSRIVILLAAQDKNISGEMPLQPYLTDKINKVFLQNISTNPTLDELCSQCGMSRSALHRFCLKYFNRPPMKTFMHMKMKHVIEVMRKNPNIKIKELSIESGFKNAFHFSRVFKKELGKSPAHYLRGGQ